MMGRIYKHAARVLVWLGPAADGSSEAIDLLKTAEDDGRKGSLALPHSKFIQQKGLSCLWDLLLKLAHRPYWRELWIIQEVLLACEITVHCGDRKVLWESFERPYTGSIPISITNFNLGLGGDTAAHTAQTGLKSDYNLVRRLSWQRTYGRKQDFAKLLRACGRNQCADRRDRVYGLLGLVKNSSFPIDYHVSTPYLFFRVIAYFKPRHCLNFGRELWEVLQSSEVLSQTPHSGRRFRWSHFTEESCADAEVCKVLDMLSSTVRDNPRTTTPLGMRQLGQFDSTLNVAEEPAVYFVVLPSVARGESQKRTYGKTGTQIAMYPSNGAKPGDLLYCFPGRYETMSRLVLIYRPYAINRGRWVSAGYLCRLQPQPASLAVILQKIDIFTSGLKSDKTHLVVWDHKAIGSRWNENAIEIDEEQVFVAMSLGAINTDCGVPPPYLVQFGDKWSV